MCQCNSVAQRNKVYQAIYGCIGNTCLKGCFIVGFDLFIGFVDSKKNIEYHQTYQIRIRVIKT